jgi:two-component system CheB/CheR fusion protein
MKTQNHKLRTTRAARDSRTPDDQAEMPQAEKSAAGFPVVGIGASAGGLAAFEAFFSGLPAGADPGMAFVLVQHLDPDHKSLLAELIRRYTRMQVFEVEDGMTVRPNCAYIIPPNHDMAFLNGSLHLLAPSAPRGHRLPIDYFFRSLADDRRERAIGIVLSGTGSDGTLGVRAIKAAGGMVMAQTPASCEYDGMPSSALATGLVDYALPPAEMAVRLIAYASRRSGLGPAAAAVSEPHAENSLKKLFILLRSQTGHDFSLYKPSTVRRRIERRMAVNHIETLKNYVTYAQQSPTEVESLFRDLLIRVTSFFRDPEAFKVLEEQAIPALFANRPANAVLRAWSAGCSTGEEAYSLAILIAERQAALRQNFKVQLFATDIDPQAIAVAHAGLYPAGIAADLSPERLARFFTAEPGGLYRIKKGLRDMLVFSEQDVIKDPPFSRLDLICCRNLMIYLNGDLQKRLIPLFHRSLNPGGVLVLGTSETVGEFGGLFDALDRKLKLYRRKACFRDTAAASPAQPLPPVTVTGAADRQVTGKPASPAVAGPAWPAKPPLRERTEQACLRQVAPSAALVNGKGDSLYPHGRTGLYLEPTPGEVGVCNILKMDREGLRAEMQSVNEELQSTNEELETSKEELQSVNEELATVNNELQIKVADLSRTNNDMNNLLSGTGIATVFVDLRLRILRFTPAATAIINLMPGDVGRPVSHIVSNLAGYDRLVEDTQAVLDTLTPKEADVQTSNGKWYTLRIQPYRTTDNVIEGAVITFSDITEIVRTRDALRTANELLRLAVVVRDARDAITVQGLDGRTLAWNPAAVRLYGWSEAEALALNVRDRIPRELRAGALDILHHLGQAELLKPYRTRRLTKAGVTLDVWMTATALVNEAGQMYAVATTERAAASDKSDGSDRSDASDKSDTSDAQRRART